jgi:hypothetical protein
LQGLLKNKPTVKRGSTRSGVTQQYVCYGSRKNPEDTFIGPYAFNPGVEETERVNLSEGTNNIVHDIKERATAAMNAENLRKRAGCISFVKLQAKYGFPLIYKNGFSTQFALVIAYSSQVHSDKDFYCTVYLVTIQWPERMTFCIISASPHSALLYQ